MKIGILTFQNQINYGGVLQAYALQRVLTLKGFDVDIIDYWVTPDNSYLYSTYLNPSISRWKRFFYFICHTVRYGFVSGKIKRCRNTIAFLNSHLKLSSSAYKTSSELEGIETYDCIICGSDQVWSYRVPGIPNPFLLGSMKASVRRVAYAASLGFKELPDERLSEYRESLTKFHAMSVREKDAVDLVFSWCGRRPEWVLDPSLLLSESEWGKLALNSDKEKPYFFCYWLGEMSLLWPILKKKAKEMNAPCRLYVDGYMNFGDMGFIKRSVFRLKILFSREVKVYRSAGPKEFISGIAGCNAVLSDSFHAMMFALVFRKPLRVFVESAPGRGDMSSRFTGFSETYGFSPAITKNVVDNFEFFVPDYKEISKKMLVDREKSLSFLFDALR